MKSYAKSYHKPEDHMTTHFNRRGLLFCAGKLGAFYAVSGAVQAQENELVIVATGGAFEKALKDHFYEPFTQATGIRIRAIAATNAETWTKLRAMQQTGRTEWDIVTAWPEDLVAQAALLEPLDCNKLSALPAQAVENACGQNGLLRTMGAVTMVHDTRKFPKGGPRTWADFWDVKTFPGPRAMPNAGAPWWPLMAALQADGASKDKLFPLDLDRAFAKLDQLRPHVTVWWRTGDQSQQIFRSGEVSLGMVWSGRAFALKREGIPLEVDYAGALPNTALWAIAKGSRNVSNAMRFLDYFTGRPEAHVPFSEAVTFDTLNRVALAQLTAEQRKDRVTAPENAKQLAIMDAAWVAQNRANLLEHWNTWLSR
jgi:mannopine transport system substrate-binding protein